MDSETTWRGGQQSLLTLARGLRTRGHAQTIVCPEASALAERARAEGFDVVAKCRRVGDIVHAHSGRAHNAVLRATLGAKLKRVVTRHVAFAPSSPLIHRLKYTKTCDGIIAVSDAVRAVLIGSGIPSSHIEVIHTGIELPARVGARPTFGPITVGHMGAFSREKGQETIVAVARELPQVRFVLAGEGPLREELQGSAPKNVEFPGFVGDAAAFLEQLDAFVMPSRSEAWGLAALEAMAHGVPVIASDIQGLAEIVERGKSGWLVPSGDVEAWTRAIGALTRAELAEFSEAARTRAAQFTVAQMAEQTERFYARLLEL